MAQQNPEKRKLKICFLLYDQEKSLEQNLLVSLPIEL